MNTLSKNTIKKLCQEMNFYPRRSSGQNFLISEKINNEIIKTAKLDKSDNVLEIGPGFGFLTDEISKRAGKVIAVELDKRLSEYLKEYFRDRKNIEIIREDIFKIELNKYQKDLDYKLISNLPYNITSLVLRNFLTHCPRPKEMILTVQKEVATRVCALPGEMSLLSVICQFYSSPVFIKKIGKEYFWPQPKIDSALIVLKKIGENKFNINEENFLKTVKTGFSAKRKKLTNNLKNGLNTSPNLSHKITNFFKNKPNVRAQEMSLDDWLGLTKVLFDT